MPPVVFAFLLCSKAIARRSMSSTALTYRFQPSVPPVAGSLLVLASRFAVSFGLVLHLLSSSSSVYSMNSMSEEW